MSATGLEGVEYGLTLWRPWSALMTVGPKDIENRPWAPPAWIIGKRIALHAGLTFDDAGWITAQAILDAIGFDKFDDRLWQVAKVKGAIVGTAVVSGYVVKGDRSVGVNQDAIPGAHESPWLFGPFGWLLTERTPLPAPSPCRGAQKLWSLPREVREL